MKNIEIKVESKYLTLKEIEKKGLDKNKFIHKRWWALWIDAIIVGLLSLFFLKEVIKTKNDLVFLSPTDTVFLFYLSLCIFSGLLPIIFFYLIKKQTIGEFILGIRYKKHKIGNTSYKYFTLILSTLTILTLFSCIGFITENKNTEPLPTDIETGYDLVDAGINLFTLNINIGVMMLEMLCYFIIIIIIGIFGISFIVYEKRHEKYDKENNVMYKNGYKIIS